VPRVPPAESFLLIAAAVTVGALVQGSVGLGLGLVAAPVVTLVEPALMPGVMIWLAAVLPVLTLMTEWRHTDWRGLSWAFLGRLPGTVLGVAVVAVASTRLLGVLVGAMVLAAVVLTWRVVTLPARPAVLAGAGVVSGVTGTATSIGGPPLALVYQHAEGPRLRATMGFYFSGGAALSLVGLGLGGQLRSEDLWTAVALLPCLVVGFLVSGPVRRHVDAGRTRSAVLLICAVSATALLVRSVV
jgi:uncharacterized membrane protein YfcA